MASLVRNPIRRIRRFVRTRSRVEVLFVTAWVLAWVQVGSTKWIPPAGRASVRAASPAQQVRTPPADAPSADLRFTSIGCSTNGVALSVAWDGGAFALPPFLEFFARTNLLAGTWDLVGWTQAAAGETNLDVVVGADRLPGGAPPPAALSDPNGLLGSHSASDVFTAAGKVAYVDVYALAFVTPAGDPVSEPRSEAGTGQNEFTYDDASASLSLSLKARVVPSPPEGRIGAFTLPDIEGTMLEWENSSNGSATANGGEFTVRATYRGYPTHNSGFGRKTATFTLGGMMVSQDFEVFFPSDGVRHPTCPSCPNCPNWFYYWREGEVCGISNEINFSTSGMDVAGEFVPAQDVILLHAGAPAQTIRVYGKTYEWAVETNQIPPVVIGDLEIPGSVLLVSNRVCVGDFPVGAIGAGIRAVAATVKHEQRHQDIFRTLPVIQGLPGDVPIIDDEGVDGDHDSVLDMDEASGRWGMVTDVNRSDTFDMWRISPSYESYGDNEVRARIAEAEGLESAYFIHKDWCNPGCNSKVKRGPLSDESVLSGR